MREIPSEYPDKPWPTLNLPLSERNAIIVGQVRPQAPLRQNLLVPNTAPPTQRPVAQPPPVAPPPVPPVAHPQGHAPPQGFAQPAAYQQPAYQPPQQQYVPPVQAYASNLGSVAVPPPARGALAQDVLLAFPKGAVIGLGAYAIGAGLWLTHTFWLAGYHWVFLLIGLVVLHFLIRFDRALVLVAAAGLWLARDLIIQRPDVVLWCIGGGVLLRLIIELSP